MLWLADMLGPEPKGGLLRSAFGLWASFAAAGVILVIVAGVVVAMRRSGRRGSVAKSKRSPIIPDAWAEAGRRVQPIRMDEPPPEVLPEDRA